MPKHTLGETRATARLPALNIEIAHGRAPGGGSEWITLRLEATPSFEAFGRGLEWANPFAFWAEAMRMAWLPWLGSARGMGFLPGQGRKLGSD